MEALKKRLERTEKVYKSFSKIRITKIKRLVDSNYTTIKDD